MKKIFQLIPACFLVSAAILSAAVAPHVGFVYPAGGTPGAKLTVTIGGQYVKDFSGINLSGTPVEVRQTDYIRIYDKKEGNRLHKKKEIIEAQMAETTDEATKQQMKRQIELLEPEIAMVAEVRREDKTNPAMAAKKQFNPQIAERLTLEITLPQSLRPGDYELRLIATNGLSNPLLFQIGQMPEVSEKEPNDLKAKAMSLPAFPVLVNGQIMPGDIDSFRFHARKGQTLVFEVAARSLVPYLADAVPGWFQSVLTLYDAKGNQVAYDDDYQCSPDPVLIYTVPADGDYMLSIRDSIFRGREDFVYRISIGELPFIERIFPLGGAVNSTADVSLYGANLPYTKMNLKTGYNAPDIQQIRVEKNGLRSNVRNFSVSPLPDSPEREPNNQFSQAQAVTNDIVINGTIGKPGDQDWFCFDGRAGEKKTVEVLARRLGSPLDSRLTLFNAQKQSLATNDDFADKSFGLITHQADSRMDVTLPATGTYFVRLNDQLGKGGADYAYRLMIGKEQPDYQLRIVPASLRIPRNGTAIVTVHAIRSGGFTGEIQLSAPDAPPGIEIQRSVIPGGADSARVVIAAKPRAEEQTIALEIEGSADCGLRTVKRRAVPAEDMMQAFLYRHLVTAKQLLVEITDPDPATVTLNFPPDGVFKVHPGEEIRINSIVKWLNDKERAPIKLTLAEPPEWLTLKTGNISKKSGEIILTVSPNAEPGDTATVLLSGTIKISKSSDDPDYNPLPAFKGKNKNAVDFTIDAISIEVTN
ncbi:MAG: hypothetical protein WCH86_07535 [Kiritimatiellales bacterium]